MTGLPYRQRNVVILGSTGSIGRQALDIVRSNPRAFRVVGLVARGSARELAGQIAEFRPRLCGLTEGAGAAGGAGSHGLTVPAGTEAYYGPDAPSRVVEAAAADVVVNAIAGLAGLFPALRALHGRGSPHPGDPPVLAMASKEPVVAAGSLLTQAAATGNAKLYPIDSETTAVAQCLAAVRAEQVARVYVTASGGPFWGRNPSELEHVRPCEAIRHPRWAMGPKISVDSATLFNKGLEVMEIARLFDLPQAGISILVHPQSVAHAMVELKDGSILAQLGPTDMRVPISQAMFWPDRAPAPPARLETDGLQLAFAKPDLAAWPCLRAALCAGAEGGTAPAAVSAADEQLVGLYLGGSITFGDIGRGLWATIRAHREAFGQAKVADAYGVRVATAGDAVTLAGVLRVDEWARAFSREWAASRAERERCCPPDQVGEDYIA